MLKKTLLILLPILLLFCFAGTAAADGVDCEVESFDYDSGAASADSGAVSLEGSETSSADAVVTSEPAVTEEALPAEIEIPVENVTAENTGTFDGDFPADEQGNDSENMPAADCEPLEGGASDPEGPAEPAEQPGTEEQACAGSDDEAAENSPVIYDPYFYYADGIKSPIYTTINDALAAFNADGGRGYIYVESGTFDENVTINSVANLTGIVFDRFDPKSTGDPFNPYDSALWPIIDGNVSISNMPSGFTLLGLVINGSVTFTGCKGQLNLNYLEVEGPGHGINIQNHTGNVVISNVEVINNTGSFGAQIDNSNGGNITITNSAFNNNASYGIDIKTNGIVTVNGIDASDNSSYGMKVYGFSRLTLSNAVFTRNSSGTGLLLDTTKAALVTIRNIYSISNEGDGIDVYTEGVVTVSDVTALNNTVDGMRINNRFGNPSAVNITRGIFGNNFVGISVLSNGAVTLTDVSAWNNFCGVYINNRYGAANVTIRSSRAGTAYHSSNNEDCGIYIASKGVVTVSDVTANNNQEHGVFIENHNANAARNVILTRVSVSGNTVAPWSRDGIYIRSRGNVLLTDVSSSNNQNSSGDYHGLYIDNRGVQIEGVWTGAGSVTIRSSRAGTTYDFSGNNRGSGIYILSNGVVTVSDVTANSNLWHGIRIENHTASAARNVILTRVSVSGNTLAPWSRDGIYILSRGNVLLTDVSSSNNQNSSGDYHGLYIDNRGVQIEGGVWTGAGSVTIRSSRAGTTYDFSNNRGKGIYIESNGVVTLSDVAADGNGTRGIDIRNHNAPTARNVTLTRCSADNNLSDHGIFIRSKGSVTLIDASASHNGNPTYTEDHGLYIRNDYGTANVTIRSSRAGTTYDFSNNRGKGIYIRSNGVVTLSDVAADGNGERGIEIRNHNAPIARNVTLTRCSADSNDETGISIYSKGAVTLTDVSASGNGTNATHHGVYIENADGTGNVTVRSSRATHYNNMSGNKGTGLQILSKGVVTVINVNAYDNDTKGININNYDSVSAPRAVNLTRCNAVNNGNRGVEVVSKGAVTLVDVSATYNNGHGVFIDNKGEGAAGNVTVRSSKAASYCDFSNNYGTGANGLDIHTNGSATVRNINASSNSNNGIYVRTYADNRNIVFQNINTFGNTEHGVSITGRDQFDAYITVNVTATGVRSYNNGHSGFALGGSTGRLNFSNCAFIGNMFYGIWNDNMVNPIVTLRNTLAAGNGTKNILF